ncbi:ABC transporter ATP-binding protein [Cellulomonas sp. CW35]|uniref:ABC transporter ATP-binding protein n=1 Tax=unclassified Cellulomonas TaxID=2620175 RepID=UPI0012FDAD9E|nr:ATP-binding cassette domain-containing protein [Cellulomonas sp. PSBB021]
MRLVADDLSFRYPRGDHDVLSSLSCDVPSGASAAIIGPSGSGKTTLLALLGGLLAPQRGRFRCVDDQGGEHVPRDVSTWVLQTVSLLPDRSVLDNVCVGAYLDGASRSEAVRRAMGSLEEMGLRERAEDPAKVLSGGEAQRVAIARALSSHRTVLFADEPTGQLDASTTAAVLDAMLASARRTVVLVTHDESAAARCDIVLRLRDGVLVTERSTVEAGGG